MQKVYARYVSLDERGFSKVFEAEVPVLSSKDMVKEILAYYNLPVVFTLLVWSCKKDFEDCLVPRRTWHFQKGK